MTAPAEPASKPSGGFPPPAPPNLRQIALQSAVAVLRGQKPAPKTADVLAMAEEFHSFLKKGEQSRLGDPLRMPYPAA